MYCIEEVKEDMHYLRIFSYVLFGVFIVLMALILVLQGVKNVDTKLMFTLLVSAAAIGGFFLYFRQQRDIDQLKRCEANINGAIILLNKIKFKYVNTKMCIRDRLKKSRLTDVSAKAVRYRYLHMEAGDRKTRKPV